MSYSSRVYRQRNPKVQDEQKGKFFSPKKDTDKKEKSNGSFFQAKTGEKEADSVADKVVNKGQVRPSVQLKNEALIRRQASGPESSQGPDKEKDKNVQPKMADQEKEKEVNVPKQGDPLKEKERTIQKMEDDKNKDKDIKKKEEPVEEKDKDKNKDVSK